MEIASSAIALWRRYEISMKGETERAVPIAVLSRLWEPINSGPEQRGPSECIKEKINRFQGMLFKATDSHLLPRYLLSFPSKPASVLRHEIFCIYPGIGLPAHRISSLCCSCRSCSKLNICLSNTCLDRFCRPRFHCVIDSWG